MDLNGVWTSQSREGQIVLRAPRPMELTRQCLLQMRFVPQIFLESVASRDYARRRIINRCQNMKGSAS